MSDVAEDQTADEPIEAPAELELDMDVGEPLPGEEGEEAPEPEAAEAVEPDEKPRIAPLTPEQQEAVNHNIAKRVERHKETEQRLQEVEQAKQAAEARLAELTAPVRPNIPDMPDPYDEQFAEKVAYRDSLIAQAAQHDARESFAQEQAQLAQQAAAEAQYAAQEVKLATYRETAEKSGISPAELQVAGNAVAACGVSQELAEYIVDEPEGPRITKYLGDNPDEAEKIAAMSTPRAAVYIAKNILPKAKKKGIDVPTPASRVEGGTGMPEGERGPTGASFE